MRQVTILKMISLALIMVFITGYAYSKTIDVIRGPEIIVHSPSIGYSTTDNLIQIKGQALRIAKLYLDGKQIYTDDLGNFTESLLLPKGYSTLNLEATDIFNRKTSHNIPVAHL